MPIVSREHIAGQKDVAGEDDTSLENGKIEKYGCCCSVRLSENTQIGMMCSVGNVQLEERYWELSRLRRLFLENILIENQFVGTNGYRKKVVERKRQAR